MFKTATCRLLVVCVCTLGASSAFAIQIGAGAFGPGAIVEDFEDLPLGPDLVQNGATGYLDPTTPFSFPSGLVLTQPNPNLGSASGIFVGDYDRGDADFGLGVNGDIDVAADLAFPAAYVGNTSTQATAEFTFPGDQLRVGAFVTGASEQAGVQITLEAFDAGNALLESAVVDSVPLTNWSTNFLGIERAGIRRVVVSVPAGSWWVLDNLTFEAQPSVVQVPALSDVGLIALISALALAAVWLLRR